MGCLRPCGIQSGDQRTIKEIVDFGQKVEKVCRKVVSTKKLLKELMSSRNHLAFDLIIANWIPQEVIYDYIIRKDEEEKERLKNLKLKELEDKKGPPPLPPKNKCLGTRKYC